MDEIITLFEIAKKYRLYGEHYGDRRIVIDEGVTYYTFQNEDYDEHYRICCEAATNFINKSNIFLELKPKEIIKVFTGMEFENNRGLISTLSHSYLYPLEVFEELLRVNKEMLVALIKAINDEKITHDIIYCFLDDNKVLGANRIATDNLMIILYRILLEYNHFSLDNLNIKNIINEIRPPMTKRAI